MNRFLQILAAALLSAGAAGTAAAEIAGGAPAEPSALRVALLGTSLTKNGGWDAALKERLSACLGRPVAVSNFGGAGKTSRWGLTQVDRVRAARPDIVVIEFSANDASVFKGFSISESAVNAETIARRFSEGDRNPKIILAAMNPMHGLRGWVRPWLDRYYDAYLPVAERIGAHFLDLRPNWRALGGRRLRTAIPDGVHPNSVAGSVVIAPPLAATIASAIGAACRSNKASSAVAGDR